MVTLEFGDPIYIAPLSGDLSIRITPEPNEAEIWTEEDHSAAKLEFHKSITGFHGLRWHEVTEFNSAPKLTKLGSRILSEREAMQ